MNAFSKIDMAEVTRLTQSGKLAEAMALLQGHSPAAAAGQGGAGPDESGAAKRHPSGATHAAIDMVAPAVPGGAWTIPGQFQDRAAGTPKMREFHTLVSKLGSLPGMAEGLGGAARKPLALPDGARFEERTFSNDAGSRTYKVYVPSGYTGQAVPVVVMLHGCTQNPDDFAVGTRMNELAEEHTFLVAYPRQTASANMQKCWNWFNTGDQQRDGGEPSLIAGIALQVCEEFSADRSRIYVAGLSAGGAAAAILASTYPDLFAAVGVHSGLACGAAKDMPSAFAAMSGAGGGGAIRRRGQGRTVPTIVFHGDADRTVSPVNGDQVAAQARPEAGLTSSVTRGEAPGGMAYTRTVQRDAAGADLLEQWVLHGAGHAWSGGSASGSYTEPRGPDASREMLRFFLAHASAKSAS